MKHVNIPLFPLLIIEGYFKIIKDYIRALEEFRFSLLGCLHFYKTDITVKPLLNYLRLKYDLFCC